MSVGYGGATDFSTYSQDFSSQGYSQVASASSQGIYSIASSQVNPAPPLGNYSTPTLAGALAPAPQTEEHPAVPASMAPPPPHSSATGSVSTREEVTTTEGEKGSEASNQQPVANKNGKECHMPLADVLNVPPPQNLL